MHICTERRSLRKGLLRWMAGLGLMLSGLTMGAWAQEAAHEVGGEASLKLPDLSSVA